jgi:hypothetical protein
MERQDLDEDDALVAKILGGGRGAVIIARATRLVVHGS